MNKERKQEIEKIAIDNGILRDNGRPVFIIDHEELRRNYKTFTESLPRVQAYYAVKANPHREIVRTFYKLGASFDVATMAEFSIVNSLLRNLSPIERKHFIWDKVIYANPVKPIGTLRKLNRYKPLVTFDNYDEIEKIRKYSSKAGLVLRLGVPNVGSVVELSSKFGAAPEEAADLIGKAVESGLIVEGISFHVGSQCSNFDNYTRALELSAEVFRKAEKRGYEIGTLKAGRRRKQLDIGGGFPVRYDDQSGKFEELVPLLNREFDRLFSKDVDILAEPGRFLVATAATLVAKVIGRSAPKGGIKRYYLNDGVYHTYSGKLFDHIDYKVTAFKEGELESAAVFGPTCDALDKISCDEKLPPLEVGDLVCTENIGAYSIASQTKFNGIPYAKVVDVNL